MDKLPVRYHDGPARRARDVNGPTHRSFSRLESNGRPFHTVEIRVATVATGSLSAGGKRWRDHPEVVVRGATGNFRPGKVGVNDQSLGASFLDRLLSLTFGNGQVNAPDPISVKPPEAWGVLRGRRASIAAYGGPPFLVFAYREQIMIAATSPPIQFALFA